MGTIPAFKLFIEIYGQTPSLLEWTSEHSKYFHYDTVCELLTDIRKDPNSTDYRSSYFDLSLKQTFVSERFVDLGEGISIYFTGGMVRDEIESAHHIKPDFGEKYFCHYDIYLLYLPSQQQKASELAPLFVKALLTNKVASTLNMVCRDGQEYYLYPFEIKKPAIELSLNYGETFVPVHDKILNTLNQKDKQGVVLLHGIPGSGKTHYIRYLINTIQDKELIYVPPDLAHVLSSPDFLPFLMRHGNSILIIEDAENIIKDRQYQDNQAVANLLNLSDGLLGDCLNLQIIATFNSDIAKIDAALLRKGRLIAEWKFDKLPPEQATRLSQHLGYQTAITQAMTLAEIYGQSEENTPPPPQNSRKIGF